MVAEELVFGEGREGSCEGSATRHCGVGRE
jgi:hypothetical protein